MGWLRSVRFQKKRAFAQLDDGSGGVQLLLRPDTTAGFDGLRAQLSTGASVRVRGSLQASPAAGQAWELVASDVELVGGCGEGYPLQKKWHSPEFLRGVAHLRPRTRGGGAVGRIRSALSLGTHEFFAARDFLHVHTPILTGCDAEGGGETFEAVPSGAPPAAQQQFFGQRAYLTVSGQLHGEALALAHGDVYTFGPCFRAEASHTTRHLAELWMIEPEMAWATLDDSINLAEDYCRAVLGGLLQSHAEDLELLQQLATQAAAERGGGGPEQETAGGEGEGGGPGLLREIEAVAEGAWGQISYREALSLLQQAEERRPGRFDAGAPSWGDDLAPEHERFLCVAAGGSDGAPGPVVVRDYPREGKAFYMRRNDDGETVAAMDVLFPRLAEVVGGGQREERLEPLQSSLAAQAAAHGEHGADAAAQLEWYVDLRRYGSVPHAGWGAGFDRLVQFATGRENIRDVIPFPRSRGHLHA